jgi:hypothetical protein
MVFCFGIKFNSCQLGDASDGHALGLDGAADAQTVSRASRAILATENSLFAVFEPPNMFLAVELDAELFDEIQLCFQKIDVLFLID